MCVKTQLEGVGWGVGAFNELFEGNAVLLYLTEGICMS